MPNFNDNISASDGNFTSFTARNHITDDIIVEIFSSSQTGTVLVAQSIGAGTGVKGVSADGVGVVGESNAAHGFIAGQDPIFHEFAGVYGESDSSGVFGNSNAQSGTGVHGRGGGSAGYGVRGEVGDGSGAAIQGTSFGTALAARFVGGVEVNGDHSIHGNSTTNGNHTVNGNINIGSAGDLVFADCAEEFNTHAAIAGVEPGSVVIMAEGGTIRPCDTPYDTRVAGVISGAGRFRAAITLDRMPGSPGRAAVALIGKVYCNVDASFSPIRVGDLLTTSPTPGHAMKASDRLAAFGAVLGKALEGLDHGQSQIPILVGLN